MHDGATAEIEGYASVFGALDLNGDIVERGAFARSLRARRASDVKMLYQHAADEPIGVWREIYEDRRGLFVRGDLLLGIEKARDVFELISGGAVNGLSIGFRAVRSKNGRRGATRQLIDIDLWEVSVVTFPMAREATISSVRPAAPGRRQKGATIAPPTDEWSAFIADVRHAAQTLTS